MFTLVMTGAGLIVFVISLITAGFSKAFKRLLMFLATGLLLDLATFALVGTALHFF